MQNGEQDDPICLDDITLLDEDCGLGTFDADKTSDSAQVINNTEEGVVPTTGMRFKSVEKVKSFYKQHAVKYGFGVRTRTSKKDDNNQLCYMKLVCSREGKYVSQIQPELKTHPTQKRQCSTCLTTVNKSEAWILSIVVHNHNHDISPTKSRLIRENRRLNLQAQRTLDINDEVGVRLNKTFRSLVGQAGGFVNLQFLERDIGNYIEQQRRAFGKEGDGQALIQHFSRMRELNNSFYYEIDTDAENIIIDVFWADARSRVASVDFGDVISFNTTYLTNKYDMPFAPFFGVNHHSHSILLGCGLVFAEDASTFTWLSQC